MTDEQVISIMKEIMKPFIVYKHLKIVNTINWRTNTPEARANQDIEILEYVDTLQEALAGVSRYSQE